nr:MAG TPA: hypothetical protein [Crassvirales sp.]
MYPCSRSAFFNKALIHNNIIISKVVFNKVKEGFYSFN